ncbi:MAG: pyruvate synthase [Candidatus Tectomicrobia bacterium]|nr:pyruvate synthase [Candidatus Tectomicrobia bacterium]
MVKEMLTGNAAAAWGARLAEVDYIPAFPITPQTEIIELLSEWVADGSLKGKFVTIDSEHSMLTAAGAASATGVRVFTATSSQGLVYGMEVLYTVAGWRVPFVLVNVARALASPITLEPDHNDVLSARDSGFLQIHTETCQEILDNVLIAYRLAEDPRVLLPVIVNLDGFYLSFTREPVEIPAPEQVSAFLPPYQPRHAFFKASQPMAQGVAVLGGAGYSYFKYQLHLAAMNALQVYDEVADEFFKIFGRRYRSVEEYRTDDADYLLVMSNAFSTKGKMAVNDMRERGINVGLLKLSLIRPFPIQAISQALRGRKGVAVIDQNISPGRGGILYQEIASALYHEPDRPGALLSFIGGLGGKDISLDEFEQVIEITQNSAGSGIIPPPQLLYTEAEWAEMKSLLETAGKHC